MPLKPATAAPLPSILAEVRKALSRRDFLIAGLSATGALVLAGCGSGSDEPTTLKTQSLSGKLVLPPTLTPDMLEVIGAGTPGTLTTDSFTATVQANVPSLVSLQHATTGKLVLWSMFDPTSSSNELSARSSAEAILFMAFGGTALANADRKALLDQIRSSARTATLAAAIQADLQSNAYALGQPSPTLKAAVSTAAQGFVFPAAVTDRVTAKALDPLMLLDPGNEVDGVTFVQTASPLGFQVQNVRRRFGSVFTYVVEHTDDKGVKTAETPPKQVGSVLEVPATRSLLHLPNGWAQATSEKVPLPVAGNDNKTRYEMIYIAPVFGGFDPPVFFDAKYAAEVPKWRQELETLKQAVALGAAVEFVLEALGLGGATLSYASISARISGVIANTTSLKTLMLAAAQGSTRLITMVESAFRTMVSADAILAHDIPELLPLIEKASAAKAAELAGATEATAALRQVRAGLAGLIALGLIELADLVAIGRDTSLGNSANLWGSVVFKPKVLLSPADGSYYPNQKVVFTATIQNKAGIKPLYHWKYSGSNLVVFDDGKVYDKLEFDSTSSFVTLTTSPSTQGAVTVTVEAFDTTDGGRVSLGGASTTLTQTQQPAGTLTPSITKYVTDVVVNPSGAGSGTSCVGAFVVVSFPVKMAEYGYTFVIKDRNGRYIAGYELGVYDLNFFVVQQPAPNYPQVFERTQVQAAYGGSFEVISSTIGYATSVAHYHGTGQNFRQFLKPAPGMAGVMLGYKSLAVHGDVTPRIPELVAAVDAGIAEWVFEITEAKGSPA
jgi:hypothetical protein